MNELSKEVENRNGFLTIDEDSVFPVNGRQFYERLNLETPYHKWFPRMCEYGFEEGKDYETLVGQKCPTNNPKNPWTTVTNHMLSIDMAKHIAMVQRTEQSMTIRQYLIDFEREMNKPEKIMARALKIADKTIANLTIEVGKLQEENAAQKQQLAEYEPMVTYYDMVLKCRDAVPTSIIAKDYGWSAKKLNKFLEEKGVQYKLRGTWLLKSKYAGFGYTKSETYPYEGSSGSVHNAINTKWTQKGRLFIYELMKKNGNLPTIERETLI